MNYTFLAGSNSQDPALDGLSQNLTMLATLLLPTFALLASAQNVINVTVGVQGSFFVPPTVSAGKGDMINFIFGGDIHTITQSSQGTPCSPLDGGFDSGLLGRGPQFDRPTQIFTLTVTDVSQPIWFYCAATRPFSHCAAGMVGVINPPSQDVFTVFLNTAKQVQNQTQYMPKVVTNGVGATAAAPSTVADLFPTATPATLTDPGIPITSLPGVTAQSTPSRHNDNRGAIIGGAVGGAAGLIALASFCAFLFFCMRKRRKDQRQQEQHFPHDKHPDFYNYNNQNPQLGHQQSFFSDSAHSNPMSPNRSPNYTTAFDGTQRGSLSPATMMQTQPLLRGNTASTSTILTTTKKPSMQLQPQRYSENATHGPSMSQGQGTIYNEQSQVQEYEVSGMTPAPHDTSMAQRQDVAQPLPLPPLHPLRLQPQHQQQYSQHHHATSSVATSDSGDGINLKALAKEVAAVLKADSSSKSLSRKARKMAAENPDGGRSQDLVLSHDQTKDSDSLRYDTAPPPKYHSIE